MRIYYSDLTRPKQAAMRISKSFPGKKLHEVQQALAVATGYSDWHELDKAHGAAPPSLLDQELTLTEFHDRIFSVIEKIANELGVPDGDVQYAVSQTRLTGDRAWTFDDHETIRTRLWRAYPMPWLGNNRVGATAYTKDKGDSPKRMYQKHHRDLIYCVTDKSFLAARTREETRMPRRRVRDFVPLRLWLPYGWWTCADGSEVLFSRDYMPMWRVRPGVKPERLAPWLWITDIKGESWFGDDSNWFRREATNAERRLVEAGITALPILADALPSIVNASELDGRQAVRLMKMRMEAGETSYYVMRSPHLHLAANSFFDFVMKRRPDESPAGDLIRDARDDPTFPSAKTWRELEDYLAITRRASPAAIEAARRVWRAFKAQRNGPVT